MIPKSKFRCIVVVGIFSCILGIFSQPTWCKEIDRFSLLKKNFPGMIEVEWGRRHLVSFCPDNTCDMLLFSGLISPKLAENYTLLYLFSASEYWMLNGWRKKPSVQELISDVVRTTSTAQCNLEDLMKKSRCIISQAHISKDIKVFSVRYDEGTKTVSKLDQLDFVK